MLNIGMTELFVFAIIALLVLGPEKLPEAVRIVAKWYSKIKRMISNVQHDLDRELRLSELQQQMQEELERIKKLENQMQQQLQQFDPPNTNSKQVILYIEPTKLHLPQHLIQQHQLAIHPEPLPAIVQFNSSPSCKESIADSSDIQHTLLKVAV